MPFFEICTSPPAEECDCGLWQSISHLISSSKAFFGFNGKEADDEWNGEGSMLAFKYRIHDARLGRFLRMDPLAPKYPGNSSYAFSENRVIDGVELEGLERNAINDGFKAPLYDPADDPLFVPRLILTAWYDVKHSLENLFFSMEPNSDEKYVAQYKRNAQGQETFETEIVREDRGTFVEEACDVALDGATVLGATSLDATDFISTRSGTGNQTTRLARDVIDDVGGGAYGRGRNLRGADGRVTTNLNHNPSYNAYQMANYFISKYKTSAFRMKLQDHLNFITTGSSDLAQAFRAAEAKMLNEGRFMDAFDFGANAARKKFGNLYDDEIAAARKQYESEVVPELQKQFDARVK